ncbi:MAG TPA: ABC transporter substrate-binding protein, partial [Acetobacteraceae bacterium]|nr:ABC transporter substrate-binding protein [Acetobacteraceae bacterium]
MMAVAAFMLAVGGGSVRAADDVVIGALYPMTGPNAQVGNDAKAAMETAAEIINGKHDIPMLLGKGGGLDHLDGAKVRLIFADHQGDPQKARAEAERLITQEHVAALIGSYQSATAATISQVADRYEVPYMSADNSSPSLNQRGLKWFFRTSPHDIMFTQAMFDFFRDIGAKTGHKVTSVVLFHEDTIFGTDSANAQKQMADAAGIKVAADIRYRGNSPSLSAEVQQIKAANADVVMPSSYTSDAILLLRGMHDVGYTPKAIMAQSAGFVEQAFIDAVGPLAEGAMSRSAFALDASKARPAIPAVNALYREHDHKDLNDNTGREITALIVLADAINRAGSTDPDKLHAALVATDIPGEQTIMPWNGVKFDATGQNIAATPVIQQIKDGKYHTIYPFDVAAEEAVWNVGK